jgi:hypothetical protein
MHQTHRSPIIEGVGRALPPDRVVPFIRRLEVHDLFLSFPSPVWRLLPLAVMFCTVAIATLSLQPLAVPLGFARIFLEPTWEEGRDSVQPEVPARRHGEFTGSRGMWHSAARWMKSLVLRAHSRITPGT